MADNTTTATIATPINASNTATEAPSNSAPPKTVLPVELWEKVASMRHVYWKLTTVKHLLQCCDHEREDYALPRRTTVRFLQEVAVNDNWFESDPYVDKNDRFYQHLNAGQFPVYGDSHPFVLCSAHKEKAGDPIIGQHEMFYKTLTDWCPDGPTTNIYTTTLIGAERVGGGALKRRRTNNATFPA